MKLKNASQRAERHYLRNYYIFLGGIPAMYDQLKQHVAKVITIPDEEMSEFVGLFTEVPIKKKNFLICPHQRVVTEYYVLKGCLKAYYLDDSGEEHIIQFAVEDWWISDFEAFFSGQLSKLYVEAIEDSVTLAIDKEVLETVYARIPKFERFFRIKTTAAYVSARKRILATLEKSVSQRYLDFCVAYPDIEKRVANYQIANYLGIQPESLSRIRKQLELTS